MEINRNRFQINGRARKSIRAKNTYYAIA